MKIVYNPNSVAEAHMLVDLLKQQNIHAFVRGENLQSLVGVLPSDGWLKIEVADGDVDAATRVLKAWEATNDVSVERDQLARDGADKRDQKRLLGKALVACAWIFLGAAVAIAWFKLPVRSVSEDANGDGKPDTTWTYSAADLPLKLETDRNFDGRVDQIITFNKRGQFEEGKSDDNFDGVFESTERYENGALAMTISDRDGDGFPETRAFYQFGNVNLVEFVSPATSKPVRVTHYRLNYPDYSDVDTNNDGVLDMREKYSIFGDVISRGKV